MFGTDSDETAELIAAIVVAGFLLPFALSWLEDWMNRPRKKP